MQEPTQPEDVLDLWNNLPAIAKGISIAGIVMYVFTFFLAVGISDIAPWYVTVGLLVWPLIIIAWLLAIWAFFVIFAVAKILVSGDGKKADPTKSLIKIIVFIPAVIGTALTVVDVFVADIFPENKE